MGIWNMERTVINRSDDDDEENMESKVSSTYLDSNRRRTRRSTDGRVHFDIASPTSINRTGVSNNINNTSIVVSNYQNGEMLVRLIESLTNEINDLLATGNCMIESILHFNPYSMKNIDDDNYV